VDNPVRVRLEPGMDPGRGWGQPGITPRSGSALPPGDPRLLHFRLEAAGEKNPITSVFDPLDFHRTAQDIRRPIKCRVDPQTRVQRRLAGLVGVLGDLDGRSWFGFGSYQLLRQFAT